MTRDDIIRMAREAGFEVYDGDRFMPTHISDTLTHLHNPAVNLATLAYEAGRKDEREWQGLTDEEVLDAWLTHRDTSEATDGFARAIEAKLKEKNHD